jgi:prepilin-type N-terminal cleavage/methylation domain-containing protein
MKKGFTIVELLMVIGIIAVLMGIVTTAASQSIRASRLRRADALCTLVQAGLAAYYAQYDEWPIDLAGKTGSNDEGVNNNTDANIYVLQGSEVRQMVKALVEEAKKGNPVMDISQLYVSRSPGRPGDNVYGEDFMDAVRSTKDSPGRMKVAEMYFGYPEKKSGYFRSFRIIYSKGASDSLTVLKQKGDD